jgi:cation transport ATPase
MFVDEEVCPMNFFHALVATLEANSDHPLAYAITNNSKEVSTCLDHLILDSSSVYVKYGQGNSRNIVCYRNLGRARLVHVINSCLYLVLVCLE